MSQFRRHLWLPDGRSLCYLSQNTGELEDSGVSPASVAACGPCIVAASVFSKMAETLIFESPIPTDSIGEATTQLLAGNFAEVGHGDTIRDLMGRTEVTFDQWVTYVVGPSVGTPPVIPDPPASPPAAGSVQSSARYDLEVDDVRSSVA